MRAEATQRVDSDFSGTLLTMAGHDLRQPLQLITSAHDVLGGLLREQEQREELGRAECATKKLAVMLNQLVEAVHLGVARDRPLGPVALAPILDELAAEFAAPARDRRIAFRALAAGDTALSHPVLLTGMLRNLIRNAIDYTPPGRARAGRRAPARLGTAYPNPRQWHRDP